MALKKEEILEALKTVHDPEIPVDIVNLGLILDVVSDRESITVTMRTTAPTCPVGDYLAAEVERAIRDLCQVERLLGGGEPIPKISVQVVDNPPWSPSAMTDEARRALGDRV